MVDFCCSWRYTLQRQLPNCLYKCLFILRQMGHSHVYAPLFVLVYRKEMYLTRSISYSMVVFAEQASASRDTVDFEPCLIYWEHDSRRTNRRFRSSTEPGARAPEA